jgi:hypothetical protein
MTTARMLFVRVAISCRSAQPHAQQIAQLKTLLLNGELAAAGNVATRWRMEKPLDFLRGNLTTEPGEFLTALVAALNDGDALPDLDRFPAWSNQPLVPLDGEPIL